MTVISTLKKMGKAGVIAGALAELQKQAVKEATSKLTELYEREKKATKVLKNIQREIEDYLLELETDLKDFQEPTNGE